MTGTKKVMATAFYDQYLMEINCPLRRNKENNDNNKNKKTQNN